MRAVQVIIVVWILLACISMVAGGVNSEPSVAPVESYSTVSVPVAPVVPSTTIPSTGSGLEIEAPEDIEDIEDIPLEEREDW